MSMVVYLEPGDDMTEFQYALMVVITTVGILVMPLCDTRLPPAVKRTQCVSDFCGLMMQTIVA